jgi:hypothetical protein
VLAPAAGGIKPITKEAPAASGTAIAASEPMYTTLTCSFPVTTTVNMLIPLIPSLPCLPLFPFNLLWFVSDCVDVCVDVWVDVRVDVWVNILVSRLDVLWWKRKKQQWHRFHRFLHRRIELL